jgi:hypothetical protein
MNGCVPVVSDDVLESMQDQSEKQLQALALAAGQVISDMEDTPAIADVPLLCSAVLLKDEVIAMLEHKTQTQGAVPCLLSSADASSHSWQLQHMLLTCSHAFTACEASHVNRHACRSIMHIDVWCMVVSSNESV